MSQAPAPSKPQCDTIAQQYRRVEGLRNRLLHHVSASDVSSCFPAMRSMATPAVLEVREGRRMCAKEGCSHPISTECQKAVTYFNDLMTACHQLERVLPTAVLSNEQEVKAYRTLGDRQSERAYSQLKRLQQDLARWSHDVKMILDAVDANKAQLSQSQTEIT